jgi:2,4-dienoyl-CoA reductase-like NADH-dependent reductase (Old Yellow Enzyme family)
MANRRQDDYGGSFESRLRFLRGVVSDIRVKTRTGFVVGLRISYTARIKHETGVITLVAGRINQPHEAELVIAEGSADMCATTRATICDPEMPNKASAVLVPAILALTEQRGLTGARAVDTYLTGFETIARIGEALGYNHYRAGWSFDCNHRPHRRGDGITL